MLYKLSQDSNVIEEEKLEPLVRPSKHDIISCLAVGGRWVTCEPNLQVCLTVDCTFLFLNTERFATWVFNNFLLSSWTHLIPNCCICDVQVSDFCVSRHGCCHMLNKVVINTF